MSYLTWVAIVAVLGLLFLLIGPLMIRMRRLDAKLRRRESVSDDEMILRYFATGEVAPEVPLQVRRVFAKHMGYPAEKLLPDDDLAIFWNGLDMIELIQEIEALFEIKIDVADAEHTRCTIRSITNLICEKRFSRTS